MVLIFSEDFYNSIIYTVYLYILPQHQREFDIFYGKRCKVFEVGGDWSFNKNLWKLVMC